ncbi:hypothetical protein [Metabacillus fastidiosus]|uniref:hypothetical protein n=1 Tax=Metabacillus fastidiosus TaxID=1458 RepID=UPI002E1CAC20|nr:hypothetical protein [Metabacillus fastidiosus]
MKKPYQDQQVQYSLYEEELKELAYNPTGFFGKMMYKASRKLSSSMDLTYTFNVAVSDYLRAEFFCDDISEEIEGEFTQQMLTSILLDDFLYQAKKRNNPYDLYRHLTKQMEQSSIEVFTYNGERDILHLGENTQRRKEMECTIKKKKALRLEIMLSDVADLGPEITFSVSDVLQIIYSDFIWKYRTGQLNNVLKKIVERL